MDKKSIVAALDHLALFDAYGKIRKRLANQAAIIMYHRVGPITNDDCYLPPITIDAFREEIEYLHKNYTIISIDTLISKMNSRQMPKNAVVITFDDGYKDNYTYAYPILEKYGIPATIYLATGGMDTGNLFWFDQLSYLIKNTSAKEINIDGLGRYDLTSEQSRCLVARHICETLKKKSENEKLALIEKMKDCCQVRIPNDIGFRYYLTWKEIKEMELINFGAHTVTHPILTRMPLESAKHEIVKSKLEIEEKTGKKITSFSYPNGQIGDMNAQIIDCVKEAGFNSAVSFYPSRLISYKDDPFLLGRVWGSELHILKMLLCGVYGDLLQ